MFNAKVSSSSTSSSTPLSNSLNEIEPNLKSSSFLIDNHTEMTSSNYFTKSSDESNVKIINVKKTNEIASAKPAILQIRTGSKSSSSIRSKTQTFDTDEIKSAALRRSSVENIKNSK